MDQIVAQALTQYAKIAGMKRIEAMVKGNGRAGNGGGVRPLATAQVAPGALALTTL